MAEFRFIAGAEAADPSWKTSLDYPLSCLLESLQSFVQKSPSGSTGTADTAQVWRHCPGTKARAAHRPGVRSTYSASPLLPYRPSITLMHALHIGPQRARTNVEKAAESDKTYRKPVHAALQTAPFSLLTQYHDGKYEETQNASHKKHVLGSRLSHFSHKGLFP